MLYYYGVKKLSKKDLFYFKKSAVFLFEDIQLYQKNSRYQYGNTSSET